MPEISRHQKQYLLQYKKEKRLIFTARILLFVLFMGLWEMSADADGLIPLFSAALPSSEKPFFPCAGISLCFPILELL